ncbi:hypothetical protein BKA56DRAFT_685551 [Ilyonectria sp. MPI-CAGE-AT-0026]|nr:hypothetical protein BKA56DRAFT_685551 [Ilyonectria sp. MPI-CAGE-AT-0026]
MHVDKTGFTVTEQLQASQIAARDATPLKYTSQMDEADWDMVLRNCCLLYGWVVDKRTNKLTRSSTPAFRLKNKTLTSTATIPALPPATSAPEPNADASTQQIVEAEPGPEPVKPLTAEDVQAPIPTKLGAIPSYAINDRSHIEITAITSEFQESMAKNHFSSSSITASISGGFSGWSAGVTGGAKSDKSGGGTQTEKQFYKKMIGTYLFPRVDMFLRPEDLEPTEELRAAIERVRRTKNINDLRKLHTTFGHLFCPSVTLGGCLQTSKIVIGTETVAQSQDKEAFKAEVGIAISSPGGTKASGKASHETQSSGEQFKRQMNSSETMTFEATGGNTILAADPPAWCGSVADFNNWRVIDQAQVTPLVDAISQMTGYSEVNSWFFSAIPKLSEYMVIPESRTMNVRFCVSNQDENFRTITGKTQQAYLGHRPGEALMPVRTSLRKKQVDLLTVNPHPALGSSGLVFNMVYGAVQAEISTTDALFYPYCTEAPMLMFPQSKNIGTSSDDTLSHSVWRLEIAQGHSIGPDTQICIKSEAAETGANLQLAVYRNAQGVFMPTITSNEEPCYWRLQRTSARMSTRADRYMYGDEVRLTWSFSDQPGGFRDYLGDIYGRRNHGRPAEATHDKLCLKVPFPRFEGMDKDCVGLVMSTALTADPIIESLPVRPLAGEKPSMKRSYQMEDLRFRIDPVNNKGRGDADDYMNMVTDGSSQHITLQLGWDKYKISSDMRMTLESGGPEAVIARNALGPLGYATGGVSGLIKRVLDV